MHDMESFNRLQSRSERFLAPYIDLGIQKLVQTLLPALNLAWPLCSCEKYPLAKAS